MRGEIKPESSPAPLFFYFCQFRGQFLRESAPVMHRLSALSYEIPCYVIFDRRIFRHGEIQDMAAALAVITDKMEVESHNIEPFKKNGSIEPDNKTRGICAGID